MSTHTRRRFLRFAAAAGLAYSLAGCRDSDGTQGSTGSLLASVVRPRPHRVPLPIPPVARPDRSTHDADHYTVVQRVGKQEILPGKRTTVWGYDGVFPGPTLVSRSGRLTVVRQHNELPVPVSTHLHGGRTPAEYDGYPTDLVLPAALAGSRVSRVHRGDPAWEFHQRSKEYAYPFRQRAATLWYHDHRMDFTGPQVWRGLAGFHLVHDREEADLPLPDGDRDIPLMIVDRAFDGDGEFRYPTLDPSLLGDPGVRPDYATGVLGDVILVNGAPWPYAEVAAARYRFRILNASNARRYELALDPEPPAGPSFIQVGSDGGLLGAPVHHRTIPIAQAERFDVVVDFGAYPVGTRVRLVNRLGKGTTAAVMRFDVVRRRRDESHVPARLADMSEFDSLDARAAEVVRRFDFRPRPGGRQMLTWTVNGQPFDPAEPVARPRLGSVEEWELFAAPAHPIHIHLVHFKVVSRRSNHGRPLPKDAGWKDVVDLTEGEQARVVARFAGYRGRYIFHCHNLEHEDMGMMARFDVT